MSCVFLRGREKKKWRCGREREREGKEAGEREIEREREIPIL